MQLRNFYLHMDATMAVYARRLYGFSKTNLTQAGKASLICVRRHVQIAREGNYNFKAFNRGSSFISFQENTISEASFCPPETTE